MPCGWLEELVFSAAVNFSQSMLIYEVECCGANTNQIQKEKSCKIILTITILWPFLSSYGFEDSAHVQRGLYT